MAPSPSYVASDIHLGSGHPERAEAFRSWLEAVAERTKHLVLNGDVFDFWFEYGSVIPRGHTRTLALLARMVDAGVRVDFVGGNHDWWGGSYLEGEIGVHFHRKPVRLQLAGRTALVAHGDGLGDGDRGYRILSSVIRNPLVCWAFRWLHPDVGAGIARAVSRTEDRGRTGPVGGTTEGGRGGGLAARAPVLERWARDQLLADPELDLVLLGHTHVPTRREVAPGRFYLNSGDWLHHRSYVEVREGEPPRLLRWDGAPQGG
jgi:UDP-2,3-diacylglucosamine hydrolase